MREPTVYDRARAEFIEKAAGMFAKDGWGVTTRELAKEGNVSPVTINNGYRRHLIEKEHQPEEGKTLFDEVFVPGKDGLITAVVSWAIARWHDRLGPVVSKTVGEPPAVRVNAAFDRLAAAVEEDATPFVILARAMFDLRYVDPGQRDEQHPGKRMALLHRRRVARLLAELMAPAVAARLGQRQRGEAADEMAWLMMSAGYAGVSGRPQDAATIRDAALLLMADRLGT